MGGNLGEVSMRCAAVMPLASLLLMYGLAVARPDCRCKLQALASTMQRQRQSAHPAVITESLFLKHRIQTWAHRCVPSFQLAIGTKRAVCKAGRPGPQCAALCAWRIHEKRCY